MSFFTFYQNNSGGYFDVDKNLSKFVIIEANDFTEANKKAEEVGIYFDGCDKGDDCSCCGDRWESVDECYSFYDVPSIYGTPVLEYIDGGYFQHEYRIHYLDGRIEAAKVRTK